MVDTHDSKSCDASHESSSLSSGTSRDLKAGLALGEGVGEAVQKFRRILCVTKSRRHHNQNPLMCGGFDVIYLFDFRYLSIVWASETSNGSSLQLSEKPGSANIFFTTPSSTYML